MDYGQTKYSQVLPGTAYYIGLHRPAIKGLTVDKYDQRMNYKTGVDCNRGLYINSQYDSKPVANRH